MKKIMLTAVFALTLIFGATANTNPVKKEVKVKESSITWLGKKFAGQHTGTIALKEGTLIMEGDELTGGSFVIDMTTITVTDLKAGKGKEKLEGHLNSDDFFGAANHPTATFEITKVTKGDNTYLLNGNLTIKGKTVAHQIKLTQKGNTFTTIMEIDRTKFGITYKSGSIFDGLKDKAIKDNFELTISLTI
jgi:polyisoprenoid-binding protein YceI